MEGKGDNVKLISVITGGGTTPNTGQRKHGVNQNKTGNKLEIEYYR